jgi:hypothetical protein
MTRSLRSSSLPALLLLGTACSSIESRQFEFDAIDFRENARPCLVVVNDDWIGAAEREQFVNVNGDDRLLLTIEFPSAEVEVIMAPLLVLSDGGKPASIPRSRKDARVSGFKDDSRRLRVDDPRVVLFILQQAAAN